MEKNAAACAMEWSIELEKALRSKKPGRAVEAILQFGSRFEQWNREPEPTLAVYNMFGLVLGEDRLFANTILLRLADAFMLGDNHTKIAIVRVFKSELQVREKMRSKKYKGIMSKARVENSIELLSRVKVVFDSGDAESRALALVLFGCWADFAKDSAQIRYLILSCLVSTNLLEVKASFFAAACFSELADDFACVVLEMLVNLLTTSATSAVRLAGAHVFAKLGCSYSVAKTAHKAALNLISENSDEDFLVAMMVSLSRLVSKSILLTEEQVNLLCSCLCCERPLRIQVMALRCLHYLSIQGACQFANCTFIIGALVSALDGNKLPTAAECDALRILNKILSHMLVQPHFLEIIEFSKLLTVIKNISRSPVMSKSFLALRILVNISVQLQGRTEIDSGSCQLSFLPSESTSLIIDRTTLLVKQLLDSCQTNLEVFQEVQALLDLLLLVTKEHPDLDILVLEKIGLLIQYLVNINQTKMEFLEDKSKNIVSTLLSTIYRLIITFIDNLSFGVFDKVKLLVDFVCRSNLFSFHTCSVYSLSLRSKFILRCMENEDKKVHNLDRHSSVNIQKYLVEHEKISFQFAEKELGEKHYWSAYKTGTYASSHGAWFTANFIFSKLIMKVHSDSCHCWLKSIMQFSLSEKKIELLFLAEHGSSLIDQVKNEKIPIMISDNESERRSQLTTIENICEPSFREELFEAYKCLRSSVETLESAVKSDQVFCFQRWFLSLRAKVIGTVGDILRVLGTISSNHDDDSDKVEFDNALKSLQDIARLSLSLKRIAEEFDLMIATFIGMDSKSSQIISLLALKCSLLAFCTGFTLFLPQISATSKTSTNDSGSGLNAMLVQNLVGRLDTMDHELSKNFSKLLEASGGLQNCLHFQLRNRIFSESGLEESSILALCSYAVSNIVSLPSKVDLLQEETFLQVIKDAVIFLSNILTKWMQIPFRSPKYFFQVRPCMMSELFSIKADTKKQDEISILPGSHLSLNLCIQLRHLPTHLSVQLTKLYCILYCRSSSSDMQTSKEEEQNHQDYRAWENEDIVEMNKKLFWYVTEHITNKSDIDRDHGRSVYQIVCFELNRKGQGFSSCLLDVSGFPVGSHRIRWYSCWIDSKGCYWSLLPLNDGPVFNIEQSPTVG